MVDRDDVHEAVEQLPVSELDAALRYLRFLSYESREEELIDAQTVSKLDNAVAEGGDAVPLEDLVIRDPHTAAGSSGRAAEMGGLLDHHRR